MKDENLREALNKAITLLYVHGVITEKEKHNARSRLTKKAKAEEDERAKNNY